MSRMSSKVISGALTIIIVGTLGILTVVSLYFYSLYLLHGDGDSKWLYVSSFVDFRKYSLLHNLIDQSVSVQPNELILWQKSWVYITLLIFSAMLSLCLLNKTRIKENRKCSAGSSSNRKEEGEGEDATINGSRASIYPLNCVHGYVNLDEMGNVLQRNSLTPPRCLRK